MIGDFYVIFYVIFGDFLVGTGESPPYCDKIAVLYGCVVLVLKVGKWTWTMDNGHAPIVKI